MPVGQGKALFGDEATTIAADPPLPSDQLLERGAPTAGTRPLDRFGLGLQAEVLQPGAQIHRSLTPDGLATAARLVRASGAPL